MKDTTSSTELFIMFNLMLQRLNDQCGTNSPLDVTAEFTFSEGNSNRFQLTIFQKGTARIVDAYEFSSIEDNSEKLEELLTIIDDAKTAQTMRSKR